MKVIHGCTDIIAPVTRPRVALGTFDGVHLGHQSVLQELVAWARAAKSEAAAVTFDRRPRDALAGLGPEHITSLQHRLLLLERQKIDRVLVLEFDNALAACEPEDFVRDILVGKLGAGGVLLGHDARFGHRGRGNLRLLVHMGKELGFEVRSVPVVEMAGRPVSSTRVRAAIKAGDLERAARLLGRPVSALGTVVRGTGRGKAIGYPTANLDLHHETRLPDGVYTTKTGIAGRWYDSVTNIGRPPRPAPGPATTGHLSDEIVTETYLLDFSGDLYGQDLEVRFLCRIRPERIFDSPEALARAIAEDVEAARACHAADTDTSKPIV